jgi:hypothetical protein
MTPEEIKQFNSDLKERDQGIFSEPWGIPVRIKEPVMYLRYLIGGVRGGSCWGTENLISYTEESPKDSWKALDVFLEQRYPGITYLQYKKLERLVHTNQETEHEYYGNSNEYMVKYIKLSELEEFISDFVG